MFGEMACRISEVTLHDFKNVRQGTVSLNLNGNTRRADILGVYGQNGSGKTALIDSLELLYYLLRGESVPESYAARINVEAEESHITYTFTLCAPGTSENPESAACKVVYDVWFGKRTIMDRDNKPKTFPDIYRESLKYCYDTPAKKGRLMTAIDTHTDEDEVFGPSTRYRKLIGKAKKPDLFRAKERARDYSRSFVFSESLFKALEEKAEADVSVADSAEPCEAGILSEIISRLFVYGQKELFVVNTANSGLISLNALPLFFKYHIEDTEIEAAGGIGLQINKPSVIPSEYLSIVEGVFRTVNIVLGKIVPGLSVEIEKLETQIDKDYKKTTSIQVISVRDSQRIPLCYESEGIKKIISILHLLICVFNSPSITVAIDEIDSGIFEYLLGEILLTISGGGQGQLIFTSHNLRPLETLPKSSIIFTTTDPNNRFKRLPNIKNSNNLRDVYYRDIVLSNDNIYEPTDTTQILKAFMKAGGSLYE